MYLEKPKDALLPWIIRVVTSPVAFIGRGDGVSLVCSILPGPFSTLKIGRIAHAKMNGRLYPVPLVGPASLCFVYNSMRSVPRFFGEPGSYHHSRLALAVGVVMMVRQ